MWKKDNLGNFGDSLNKKARGLYDLMNEVGSNVRHTPLMSPPFVLPPNGKVGVCPVYWGFSEVSRRFREVGTPNDC